MSPQFLPGKYQPFGPLDPEEYAQLEQLILAKGGLERKIVVDENGNIITGNHRWAICQKHGLECLYEVKSGLTEEEKWEFACRDQMGQRNLSAAEKRAMAKEACRREREGARARGEAERSARAMGRAVGVNHHLIIAVREELDLAECPTGSRSQLDSSKAEGRDGKSRPKSAEEAEAKREEIDAMIAANPEKSDREIAREKNTSPSTVAARRRKRDAPAEVRSEDEERRAKIKEAVAKTNALVEEARQKKAESPPATREVSDAEQESFIREARKEEGERLANRLRGCLDHLYIVLKSAFDALDSDERDSLLARLNREIG